MTTKKLTQTTKKVMKSLSLVTLLFSLAFASCSESDDPPLGQGDKVAVIFKEGTSAFFKIMQLGIEAAAKQSGLTVECYYADSEVDYEGQLEILRSLDLKQYKG